MYPYADIYIYTITSQCFDFKQKQHGVTERGAQDSPTGSDAFEGQQSGSTTSPLFTVDTVQLVVTDEGWRLRRHPRRRARWQLTSFAIPVDEEVGAERLEATHG